MNARVTDTELDGNAGDKGDELARLGDADPDVPVCKVAGRLECPGNSERETISSLRYKEAIEDQRRTIR